MYDTISSEVYAMNFPLLLGLNNTANPPNKLCSLETICGFGGASIILLFDLSINYQKVSTGKTLANGSGLFPRSEIRYSEVLIVHIGSLLQSSYMLALSTFS
jgi:hypothetical protein